MATTIPLSAFNQSAEEELERSAERGGPPPDWRGDPGLDAIANVYGPALSIDKKWSLRWDRGFAWWGHRHRQTVWADPGFDNEGVRVFRLCAVTEVAQLAERGSPLNSWTTDVLDLINAQSPSTGTYVFERETGRLRYWTSMYVHEGTAAWAARDFGAFAIMGLIHVESRARHIEKELPQMREELAPHPRSGPRETPDETLELGPRLIGPVGQDENLWLRPKVLRPAMKALRELGFSVEPNEFGFSFGLGDCPGQGACVIVHCIPLRAWGAGCLLWIDLGATYGLYDCLERVMDLNLRETRECSRSHLAGGWLAIRDGFNPLASILFRSFIPNILFAEGKLLNYCMGLAIKAQWAAGIEAGILDAASR